jgi:hypothetical protein
MKIVLFYQRRESERQSLIKQNIFNPTYFLAILMLMNGSAKKYTFGNTKNLAIIVIITPFKNQVGQ